MPTCNWFPPTKCLFIGAEKKRPGSLPAFVYMPVFILKKTPTRSQIFPVDQVQYPGIDLYIEFPGKKVYPGPSPLLPQN